MLETVLHFLEETGISETAFGALAMNDPRLVIWMRAGRELSPEAVNRVMVFMENYATRGGPTTRDC